MFKQIKLTKLAKCGACGNEGVFIDVPEEAVKSADHAIAADAMGGMLTNMGLPVLLFGDAPIIKMYDRAHCSKCNTIEHVDNLDGFTDLPDFSESIELTNASPESVVSLAGHLGIHREAMMWFMECVRTNRRCRVEDLPENKVGTLGVSPFPKLPNAVRFENDRMNMILAFHGDNRWSLMGILKE